MIADEPSSKDLVRFVSRFCRSNVVDYGTLAIAKSHPRFERGTDAEYQLGHSALLIPLVCLDRQVGADVTATI
jgi:hypothetical protein